MNKPRLTPCCAYCEHCNYTERRHWSTLTGSDAAHFGCVKGHHGYTQPKDMLEGELFRIAQNCGDFQLSRSVIKEITKELRHEQI